MKRLVWLLPIILAMMAQGAEAGTVYSAKKIAKIPGGTNNVAAYDLNNLGQVVGVAETGTGASQAFLWENGVTTGLTMPMANSVAFALNDTTQITGAMRNDSSDYTGYRWDAGVVTPFNPASQPKLMEATVINASGTVAGHYWDGAQWHGYTWDDVNGFTELPTMTLGGSYVDVQGITDAGVLYGRATLPNGTLHAFKFENGVITDLGASFTGSSEILSTSADGVFQVGSFRNAQSDIRMAFWENGVFTDLGLLNGFAGGYAWDVNILGDTVGVSFTNAIGIGDPTATLWQDGNVINLNDVLINSTSHPLAYAIGINNLGQILAIDEFNSSYVLTPTTNRAVPEPSSLALAGLGIGCAVALRRRRRPR